MKKTESKIREYFDVEDLTSDKIFHIFSDQLLSIDFIRELDNLIPLKHKIDFEAGIYARIIFFFDMTKEYRINVANYLRYGTVINTMQHLRLKEFVDYFMPKTKEDKVLENWRKKIRNEWSYSNVEEY